jgi:integration host factor subunit beta
MTKPELIDELARAAHLTKDVSEAVVTAVFERITAALVKGERVDVRGFGALMIRHRRPRIARNPKTGATVSVPAQRIPFFQMGKALRAKLNPELGPGRQEIPVASIQP